MNLVIDWGNTRIKAAFFDKGVLLNSYNFTTKEKLEQFLRRHHADAVLISSVKGHPNELSAHIEPETKIIFLSKSTFLPINNKYSTPDTLGVDRLAAACGAWALFPNRPSLVIDLGSCINYEFVDGSGNYCGGAISPGITMRFQAMHTFTSKLPQVKPIATAKLVGDSTTTCLQSGVMNGVLLEINGFAETIRTEHPQCPIIVCGGDAHFFEGKIKDANFVPELVLMGLNNILSFNLKQR
jgi:type III pantothenate kinase